jgi:hypothetical protein
VRYLVLIFLVTGCGNVTDKDVQITRNESAVTTCLNVCPKGVEKLTIEYSTVKCECAK